MIQSSKKEASLLRVWRSRLQVNQNMMRALYKSVFNGPTWLSVCLFFSIRPLNSFNNSVSTSFTSRWWGYVQETVGFPWLYGFLVYLVGVPWLVWLGGRLPKCGLRDGPLQWSPWTLNLRQGIPLSQFWRKKTEVIKYRKGRSLCPKDLWQFIFPLYSNDEFWVISVYSALWLR